MLPAVGNAREAGKQFTFHERPLTDRSRGYDGQLRTLARFRRLTAKSRMLHSLTFHTLAVERIPPGRFDTSSMML